MGISAGPSRLNAPALGRAVERVFAGRAAPLYELAMPASRSVDGVALMVHGGGWVWVGPGTLRGCDMHVERWLARGWATMNVDYRAGGDSITDVLAFHDALRGWAGTRTPLGIVGVSAGGHLGLMTAAQRRGVNWVVGIGAPTDLAHLGGTKDADNVRKLAQQSFGASVAQLRAASPVTHAHSIDAHVLLAASTNDAVVPPSQVHAFLAARPRRTTGMVLEGGPREFIHAGVSDAAYAAFARAEERLLEAAPPRQARAYRSASS